MFVLEMCKKRNLKTTMGALSADRRSAFNPGDRLPGVVPVLVGQAANQGSGSLGNDDGGVAKVTSRHA